MYNKKTYRLVCLIIMLCFVIIYFTATNHGVKSCEHVLPPKRLFLCIVTAAKPHNTIYLYTLHYDNNTLVYTDWYGVIIKYGCLKQNTQDYSKFGGKKNSVLLDV